MGEGSLLAGLLCSLNFGTVFGWGPFWCVTTPANRTQAAPIRYDASETASIPDFVVKYAPVVHLYSEEQYLPGSIEDYVSHFEITAHDTNATSKFDLSTLSRTSSELSSGRSADSFMKARDDWYNDPAWVTGAGNVPALHNGRIANSPATLIVVDKGEFLDAFWFYFYPFNLGPYVMGAGPYGNHLGDWEHSLVRFKNGVPQLVWMSAHGGGTAYRWDAMETVGDRGVNPILFAARGTHALYVSVGQHSHDIPWHMLSDFTDRGMMWEPAANFLAYVFDGECVRPANGTEEGRELAYGDWLLFDGLWGDPKLPRTDARQAWGIWEWRMIDGPQGPLSKNLMRRKPCQRYKWWNVFHSCRVRNRITPGEGIEADAFGCAAIIERLPRGIDSVATWLLRGGYLCFWLDRLWG